MLSLMPFRILDADKDDSDRFRLCANRGCRTEHTVASVDMELFSSNSSNEGEY